MFTALRLNAETYPVEPVEHEELAKADARLVLVEGQRPEEISAAAADCDALLVVSSAVPESLIARLNRCRVISRLGAGTDKIDIDAATARGIVVANVPDFCTHEQAEHTLALLLAWVRRLPYMQDAMRCGEWTARSHSGVHRLAGQTLGLVGFGASAQQVARIAGAFGLRLLAWARNPEKYAQAARAMDVKLASLDDVLSRSDFISLHLPLTADTRHILNAQRLARMKPTAMLLNTARGALVDEAALVEALQTGRICGAALDVFEGIDVFARPGQPADHPLLKLGNVLLTPHCAGSSVESSLDSKTRGARNAASVLAGQWPPHVVNNGVEPRWPLR